MYITNEAGGLIGFMVVIFMIGIALGIAFRDRHLDE